MVEHDPMPADVYPARRTRWVLGYLLFGAAWIVGSDYLLGYLNVDSALIAQLQLAKGLGFVAVTAALLYFLLPRYRRDASPGASSRRPPPSVAGKSRLLLFIFALFLLVPALGAFIYFLELPRYEREAFRDLKATAALKSAQVTNWLAERRHDGMTLVQDPAFVRLSQALVDAGDEAAGETLTGRLRAFKRNYGYRAVNIIDTAGKPYTFVGAAHHDDFDATQVNAEAHHVHRIDLATGATVQDRPLGNEMIHHIHGRDDLHIHFVFALRDNPREPPFGYLQIDLEPQDFLFPYITRWPSASASGETLLAERWQERVVFFTPLRHKTGRPGTLSHPLSDNQLPAAVALRQGGAGTFAGEDYRGVPVFAAYHPIPGTPWQLIAKLDRDEMLMPLFRMLGWVSLVALLGVAWLSAVLYRLWQQQQRLASLTVEAERRRADELLQQFFDLPFIGIAITLPKSKRWLRFNEELCRFLGYSRDELAQKDWAELTHPDDLEADVTQFERVMRGETDGYRMDKRFIRRDGTVVDAYIDVKCVRTVGGEVDYFVAMVQDISERKRSERQLQSAFALLDFALREMPVPVMIVRVPEMTFSHVNPAAMEMAAERPDDYTVLVFEQACEFWPSFHPDGRQRFAPKDWPLTQAIDQGETVKDVEMILDHPAGERWVLVSAAPLHDEAGRITAAIVTFPDITEQKRAQQALEQARQQAQHYLDIVGVMMISLDRGGRIQLANPRACEILGYVEQELLGSDWFDTCLPDRDRGEVRSIFNRLIAGEIEPVEYFENPVVTVNGDERLIAWHNSVIRGDDAVITGILSSGEDITEQREAQRALEKARRQAQQYLDIAGVMLIVLDNAGRARLINRRASEILGYDEQELIGKEWFEVCVPERYRDETHRLFETLLAGDVETAAYVEQPLLTRSGEERLVAWHNSVIRDDSGAITGTLSSGEDVTELRRSEGRLRTLVDTIPDLVWLKDADGCYLACNPMFERFFGATEDEIVGKTDYDFVDRELADFFREHDGKAMAAGRPTSNEETLVFNSDGYRGTFETIKTPMYDQGGI